MAKFRVKEGGEHVDVRGKHTKTYKPGDVVESALDLTKVFRNKFERVAPVEAAPVSAPVLAPVPTPQSQPEENWPPAKGKTKSR